MRLSRAFAALLVPLLLVLCIPATAQADHLHDEPPAWWEDEPPEESEPQPVEPPPIEAELPPVEVEPPIVLEPPVVPTPPVAPAVELVRTATVAGRVARMRTDGLAAIPRAAPKRVRTLIAAVNRIIGKPYKWGGGHARLLDKGYDCSGAVSYALIGAGLLASPQVSGRLARFGAKGAGRWVTVYANKGHVYLEVAGLRLDTSSVGDTRRRSGVRWRPLIGARRGFAVRHPVGL